MNVPLDVFFTLSALALYFAASSFFYTQKTSLPKYHPKNPKYANARCKMREREETYWIKVNYKGIEQNWLRNRCYRINTIQNSDPMGSN